MSIYGITAGFPKFSCLEVTLLHVKFEVVGEIRSAETIASGHGVRNRRRLIRQYGRGRWRKMKGIAAVRLGDGTLVEAELHWYEAHGIGKKELKLKKPLGNEG